MGFDLNENQISLMLLFHTNCVGECDASFGNQERKTYYVGISCSLTLGPYQDWVDV